MKAGLLNHFRSNVVGYIAIVLYLTTGTAYALTGSNTIFSDDIVNGQVKTADIGNGQVRSADVANDTTGFALTGTDVANGSLTGFDVQESTLSQVPSALFGGLGRSTGGLTQCDPDGLAMETCVRVDLTLPRAARVLLIGRVTAAGNSGPNLVGGSCALGSDWTGPLGGSLVGVQFITGDYPQVPLVGVTPVVGPGTVSFGIDCNQNFGAIRYWDAHITAVALSAS